MGEKKRLKKKTGRQGKKSLGPPEEKQKMEKSLQRPLGPREG